MNADMNITALILSANDSYSEKCQYISCPKHGMRHVYGEFVKMERYSNDAGFRSFYKSDVYRTTATVPLK